ncbi:MAG: hypothetical protein WBG11_08025 [Methylocella sp.]
MVNRNEIVKYLVAECFGGDTDKVCSVTSFTKQQVTGWLEDKNQPHPKNVSFLMHRAFAPEFRVIAEYVPIVISKSVVGVHKQLATILKGYEKACGLYAFYDSMVNLIYIGKSDGNLLEETYQQLKADVKKPFPKGVRQPGHRFEVVRYISAYYVQPSIFESYAKHVESLILRISKPALNSNIGKLEKAEP